MFGDVIRVAVRVVVKFDSPFDANDLAAARVGVPDKSIVPLTSAGTNPGDCTFPLGSVKLIPLGNAFHCYRLVLAA